MEQAKEILPITERMLEDLAEALWMVSKWGAYADSQQQIDYRRTLYAEVPAHTLEPDFPAKDHYHDYAKVVLTGVLRTAAVAIVHGYSKHGFSKGEE